MGRRASLRPPWAGSSSGSARPPRARGRGSPRGPGGGPPRRRGGGSRGEWFCVVPVLRPPAVGQVEAVETADRVVCPEVPGLLRAQAAGGGCRDGQEFVGQHAGLVGAGG